MTSIKFWMEFKKYNTGDGTPLYPDRLYLNSCFHWCTYPILVLQQRVFSFINRMKTKTRNRQTTATIIGLLHTRRLMTERNCCDLEDTRTMTSKSNSDILYNSSEPEDMYAKNNYTFIIQ